MQDETWSFATDTSIVNGYAFSGDTLFLEISFLKKKPRLVIEFFRDIACKNWFIYIIMPYAHQQLRPGSEAMEGILAKTEPQWAPPI